MIRRFLLDAPRVLPDQAAPGPALDALDGVAPGACEERLTGFPGRASGCAREVRPACL